MYSYYNDEIIEEVRIHNDIVDVIGEYVKLEKKGKDYFGLCPFHKEKTPSFSVVSGKQIYYCFGCGKGGNVIHFIMNAENLEFVEAVRYLAERARIQLPEGENEEEKELARLKQEIVKINTEAARFFFNKLNSKESVKASQYLAGRKISGQTIRKFGIGYSPDGWDELYKHLQNKSFDEAAITKSGLVLQNKNHGYYDRFRGRIMFPIFDIRGNVIGFGGRVMDSSTPKYMNSPETPVYNKGRNLYALNFAKNSDQKSVIVVEGYMDVISLHQCGIINTVASLGTALTENQGRILKKYAEEIIISYDADAAGQAATMRGLDLLNQIGCNVKVLIIPEGKDPDEFVKKNGADALKKLIEKAISLVEYKIKVLKNQVDTSTTEGKINFLNKIADLLAKLDNNVEREMYVGKLAKEYEIREESLFAEIYKKIRPQKSNFKSTVADVRNSTIKLKDSNENEDIKLIHYERLLLALLCVDNTVYKLVSGKLGIEDFTGKENRQVAELMIEKLKINKSIVPAELLSVVDEDTANVFTKIIQQECNFEDNNKAVLDIIKGIELYKLEKRKKEILDLLNNNNNKEKIEGDVGKLNLELNSIIISIQKKKGN